MKPSDSKMCAITGLSMIPVRIGTPAMRHSA